MLTQRALEAFQAVMDAGSVTAAAHALGVSQPAISRLLRELEERTGLVLFERSGNRIVPTEDARALSIEVERAFVGLSRIEAAARDIALGSRATLGLAAIPALASAVLPDVVAELRARSDDAARTRVDIQSVRGENVLRAVRAREVQLGFVTPLHEAPDVAVLARHAFRFECVAAAGHPLPARASVAPEALSGHELVALAPATATGRMLERLLADMDAPPAITARSHLSSVVCALALRGLGVAIVDPFSAAEHRAKGGSSRPFETDERFSVSVIGAPGHHDRGGERGGGCERVLAAWGRIAGRFGGEAVD